MEVTRRGLLAAFAAQRKRPNIVFGLADDLGYGELGCYGNRFNETPHLDRLASDGVRFTQAYAAAPLCSPTRVSLMVGQHPARVGILDSLRADDPNHLSPKKYDCVARRLRAAGYRTGLVGKWHLMGDCAKRLGDPKLHGFDEVICSESRYIGHGYYKPPYEHMPEVAPKKPDEYLTDRLNEEAVDFVGRAAGAVRMGDWKLIRLYDDRSEQLFHLREDPGEQKDLSASQPGRVRQLRKTFMRWQAGLP